MDATETATPTAEQVDFSPTNTSFSDVPQSVAVAEKPKENIDPEREHFQRLIETIGTRYWKTEESTAAKQELINAGEKALEQVVAAAMEYRISSRWALEIIKEIKPETAIPIIERSLVTVQEDSDYHFSASLIDYLVEKDFPSSVGAVVQFTHNALGRAENHVAGAESLSDFESVLTRDADILQTALNRLTRFSDREGFRQAETLYDKYETFIDRVNERESQFPNRVEPFITEIPQIDLSIYPQATPEQEEAIKLLIGKVYDDEDYQNSLDQLRLMGRMVVPVLYRSFEESSYIDQDIFGVLDQEDRNVLLRAAIFNERIRGDIKNLAIYELRNGEEVVPLISEFIRREAEKALTATTSDERLDAQDNFRAGLDALARYGQAEAYRNYRLLTKIYSELRPGYESLSFSLFKVERPSEQERLEWRHDDMYIRGSALFASMLGRGQETVRDVDVFLTDRYGYSSQIKSGYFENIEDLKNILGEEKLAKLKSWVDKNGFSGKRINLVKISQNDLRQEETFQDEPGLMLWNQIEETSLAQKLGSILSERHADLYQKGELFADGISKLPERLLPNGTLARALRSLELAKRFGLEYDDSILKEAEKAAKNGSLIILNDFVSRFVPRAEQTTSSVLDKGFIKVFTDKNLRKGLIQTYPRLGQISEDIVTAGGIEQYIIKNFGEAYLQIRKGHIRLYDVNLTSSPANITEQKHFIESWYREPREKAGFSLIGFSKVSDETALAKPEVLEGLIDQEALKGVLRLREERNLFLERVQGRYRLDLRGERERELQEKINSYLRVMNMEWPASAGSSKDRTAQTLIRLGIHPRNPVLAQFSKKETKQVDLVISADPRDILQASTAKPWVSCVNLDQGAYGTSPYEDIGAANVVAYVTENEGGQERFVSRRFVRAGFTLNDFQPAAAVERMYGDERYQPSMKEALIRIIASSGIKTETPMLTYPHNGYFDSDSGMTSTNNHYYYTVEKERRF